MHGTTEGQGKRTFTVGVCGDHDNDDIRKLSNASFGSEPATSYTVTIMDGLLLPEGERFDLPVQGSDTFGLLALRAGYGD